MPRIIKETVHDTWGKEKGLSVIARFFLVTGMLILLISVIIVIATVQFYWIAIGVGGLLLGVLSFVILDALSEMVRLLKKQCGLPYGGKISGTEVSTIFICSECGSSVWQDSLVCQNCNAYFGIIHDPENSDSGNE